MESLLAMRHSGEQNFSYRWPRETLATIAPDFDRTLCSDNFRGAGLPQYSQFGCGSQNDLMVGVTLTTGPPSSAHRYRAKRSSVIGMFER